MKIISDIRIFKDMRMGSIDNKIMHLAAHRVAMKLREEAFSLGDYDHLYLCFSSDKPVGSVILDETVDKYHPWFRKVCVGISADELSAIETNEAPDLLLKQIENVLLELFGNDHAAAADIRYAVEEAKKGPEMMMHFKEKKTAKGTATIYLRLLNNGHYLPLLSVTNTVGEEIFRADLPETINMITIGEIQLSSKKVAVKPRKNSFAEAKTLEPVSFEIKL